MRMRYYEPMQPSNLQIIEKILADIYSRKRPLKDGIQSDKSGEFFCKLGANVACYGSWTSAENQRGHAEDKYARERIKLLSHGQIIANINIKHDAREIIQVFSARCGDNGILSRENLANKQLQIFHAPDETADDVVNTINNEIALSKAERAYKDRFGDYRSLAERLGSAKDAVEFEKLSTTVNKLNEQDFGEDLLNQIFTGEVIELPHDKIDFGPQEYCNLRKPQWAYHDKLTTPISDFLPNGLKPKSSDKQKD